MELENFGRLGYLTKEQEQTLENFKQSLGQLYNPQKHDEYLLLRFLRARKFNLEKAIVMFTECENWRRDFNVDEIYESFQFNEQKQVHEIYPRFYHKIDKEGRSIYIERLEFLDLKKLYQVTTEDRLIKNVILEYEKLLREKMRACSDVTGKHIEQCCTILDLKNVPVSQFYKVSSFVQKLSAIAQNYYPEILGQMFIINAPFLFTGIWKIVKQFLDEATTKKIKIIGSKYQEDLLQVIDAESLPEFLGGSCKCAKGCDKSEAGPWNDIKYKRTMQEPFQPSSSSN